MPEYCSCVGMKKMKGTVKVFCISTVLLFFMFYIYRSWINVVYLDPAPPIEKLNFKQQHLPRGTKIKVALTAAITTRGSTFRIDNIEKTFLLYSELAKTLCETGSPMFDYGIYAAFDNDDPWLTKPNQVDIFKNVFKNMMKRTCQPKGIHVTVKFFRMNYTKLISPAMNDASMEAYYDGYEYFYRVNDDTLFKTPGWTQGFIEFLLTQNPENVGATCPDLIGDNQFIWQYDFVHRRHIEIHGVYYPRIFTEWYQTEWITYLYEKRGKPLTNYKILHTKTKGTRYSIPNVKDNKVISKKYLFEIVHYGQYLIDKYVRAVSVTPVGSDKVIAFSTDGSTFHKIFGIVRNAQLARIFFPGWLVRVYIENVSPSASNYKPVYKIIPTRFQNVLEELHVQIVYPNSKFIKTFKPHFWKNLVADDSRVKRFIVRDVEGRLSERDAKLVHLWELSGMAFHVIYDGPDYYSDKWVPQKLIQDSAWGGTYQGMKKLGQSIKTFLSHSRNSMKSSTLLPAMFKQIRKQTLVHGNMTKCPFAECQPIPLKNSTFEYFISQKFADNEVPK